MRKEDVFSCHYIQGNVSTDIFEKRYKQINTTIDRVEQLAREKKQPVLDNSQPLFEWLPGKYIEDYHHDPIIQQEEEPQQNEIEQQQDEIEQQLEREENYITDQETIGDEEE